MKKSALNQETLAAYEDILVQEFRTLQNLINLTNEERQVILKRDYLALMQVVEQKEALLDQFNLMEDTRRNLSREISLASGIATQSNSLAELLPHLESLTAARLERINQGVSILASQARELNQGNTVMAANILENLGDAQAYLLQVAQVETKRLAPNREIHGEERLLS